MDNYFKTCVKPLKAEEFETRLNIPSSNILEPEQSCYELNSEDQSDAIRKALDKLG